MGVDPLLVGPMPTPGIAFLTRSLRADAGVAISASHNPFEDNGIKFFGPDGFKLPDAAEASIETLMAGGEIDRVRPIAGGIGKAFRIDDAVGRYNEFVKNVVPRELTFDGLRIVVDTAHGAAYRIAPTVISELGADVTAIGNHPDGLNINDGCGSLHLDVLRERVLREGADLGVGLDGDADRVLLVDETGEIVDGDRLMAILALDLQARGKLRKNTVVATVMSNLGLEVMLRDRGIEMVRTAVGDRYVVERMRADGFNFGGEQSGHIVNLDVNTTGDGLVTALSIIAILAERSVPLSELRDCMTVFPQRLINVRVRERRDLIGIAPVTAAIRAAEAALGDRGRVLVRYSGTELLARVMVEGEDSATVDLHAEVIADALRTALGAPGQGS
jgi:phosphoglucosamine mutase